MKLKISIISVCLVVITLSGVCFGATCTFTSTSSTLPFGTLDPASSANATATMTIGVTCSGGGNSTWFLTTNNGLYYAGTTKRMRHQTVLTEYLPYSVTFSPTTGNRNTKTITGTGTILNSDYINAYIGNYSDQVTLTITP
jgi:spore coat protein U-like protein